MLFAVILTNWTLAQRRVRARPQDPSSGNYHLSSERRPFQPLPARLSLSLLQTGWKSRVGLTKSERGAGAVPRIGAERRRRVNLHPSPAPTALHPQRELLSRSPRMRGPAARSALEAVPRGTAGHRNTIEVGGQAQLKGGPPHRLSHSNPHRLGGVRAPGSLKCLPHRILRCLLQNH